jgi:hypothetical protein
MVDNVEVRELFGKSDHNILIWRIICDLPKSENRKSVKLFHKANNEEMRRWFSQINWQNEFETKDVNVKWARFCELVESAVNQLVPVGYEKREIYPK